MRLARGSFLSCSRPGIIVVGTTRSARKADALRATGVGPVVLDVFDTAALTRTVSAARPDVVIHQLTDLPPGLHPSQTAEGTKRNAHMRTEGTRILVSTTLASGARRLIAQSIAWIYAPGPQPHSEEDPLDTDAQGTRAITVAGVVALERLTVSSPPIDGIVLRYGHLYGPNTGSDIAKPPALHVDAVASAALLAIEKASRGILNIGGTECLPFYREGAAGTWIRSELPDLRAGPRTAIVGRLKRKKLFCNRLKI